MMMIGKPTLEDKIRTTLETQYAHVESYCDAQTTLGNLLINRGKDTPQPKLHPHLLAVPPPPDEYTACLTIQQALSNIRQDWNNLQELLEETQNHNHSGVHSLLQQHWSLSKRVLQTVQDVYHRNGIPIPTNRTVDPTERKTIALATLRASIARIQQAMK